ncbi:MAG TPA: hypothetical protein VJN29_11220 [Intrasporangium sp.]|uniref:hypothetical protein n=1 Tax=Intrasporangium sp. TaxID=1925024 RepID=UPI002B49EE80|nr:hypothetical protein [Intrasporangium sp.]HKX67786.1 hypothetical protein [Intrasporangium sp.]
MENLTFAELDTEMVSLLPSKETLYWGSNYNWANIYASNSSVALNAVTAFSQANSAALQTIAVSQG